jgi:hypothetical protein
VPVRERFHAPESLAVTVVGRTSPNSKRIALVLVRLALLGCAAITAALLVRSVIWNGWWGHTSTPATNEFADLPTPSVFLWILVPLAGVLTLVHPVQRALARLGVPWRSLALVCVLAPTFVAALLVSALYARFTQGLFVTLATVGTGGFLLAAYTPHLLRGVRSGTVLEGRCAKWVPRVAMSGVFAVFFGPTVQFPDVWDRVGEEGSFAMQNAILFRAFPPPDFSVPGKPLIYHYGYDAAVSAFALISRLPLDAASNAVSLLALVWLMVLARQLASFLGAGAIGQAVSPAAVALFGGLPFYVGIQTTLSWWKWLPGCAIADCQGLVRVNPPTGSYLYQREWPLGLPLLIAIVVLVVASSRRAPTTRSGAAKLAAVGGVLLGALSITNISSFGLSGLALGATIGCVLLIGRAAPPSRLLAGAYLTAGTLAVPVALALGGFTRILFESPANGFAFSLFGMTGNAGYFLSTLILSCGVTVVLAPFVFRRSWPHSAFPAAITAIGLGIPLIGYYTASVDVFKFWVPPVAIVGLFAGITLDRAVRDRPRLAIPLAAAVAVGCISSLFFFSTLDRDSYKDLQRPAGFTTPASPPMLISELAKRVLPAGQSIACSPELVNYCGTYGGFPELAPNVITTVEGLYVERLKQQEALETKPPANVHVLERYNVTMIIVGPESTVWNPRVAVWRKEKQVRLIGEYQGYDLYQIVASS